MSTNKAQSTVNTKGSHAPDVPSQRDGTESSRGGPTGQKPTVFILDKAVRSDLFEFWLSGGCRVLKASTLAEVREKFDASVAVALVRNEARDELKTAVEEQIAMKSPFCRTVITTTERVEIMFPGIEYDVCVSEPTTKASIRETVSRLTRRAQYQAILKDYYRLSFRAANLEVKDREGNLHTDDEYSRVKSEAGRLKDGLEDILETFDDDDLTAVQQSIRPETNFGPESTQRNRKQGEKHRPDKCVGCGLEWDVDHGGTLDQGYKRLGAFVWKCAECGTVQNIPDPSHRKLTRR